MKQLSPLDGLRFSPLLLALGSVGAAFVLVVTMTKPDAGPLGTATSEAGLVKTFGVASSPSPTHARNASAAKALP